MAKKKTGRPSIYSDEIVEAICAGIREGKSVRSICLDKDMPCEAIVYVWLQDKPEFLEKYIRAREGQADYFAEEIIDIADNANNDYMEKKDREDQHIGWVENGEFLRRSHLRIEARKWLAARMAPKKYGDLKQVEMAGKDGGPIKTEDVSPMETARRVAFLLASADKENK